MNSITFDAARPLDMILLGRIAVDLNPLDGGRTLAESELFKKYVGGSPANIAVGLARLGKKCGFFARVSADRLGEFAVGYLEKEGVDVSRVRVCENGESLGLTFTEMLSPEESRILMYRNGIADLSLSVEDIDEAYLSKAKALLISGTALSAGPSREAALKAAVLAKKNGVRIIFDIDYRPYTWKSREETALYDSIMAGESDVILGSREEYDLTEHFLGLDGSDKATAGYWMSKQASIVVIKHGKDGSAAYTRDGSSYAIRPFPVKAVKGFGGGDGYASSFLYGLLQGYGLERCLELGSASASMLVASHGCSADMPGLEDLTAFLEKEKAQYGDMVAADR